MVKLQYPFKGQQVLTLIGSEQTTSSLVVMIAQKRGFALITIVPTATTAAAASHELYACRMMLKRMYGFIRHSKAFAHREGPQF